MVFQYDKIINRGYHIKNRTRTQYKSAITQISYSFSVVFLTSVLSHRCQNTFLSYGRVYTPRDKVKLKCNAVQHSDCTLTPLHQMSALSERLSFGQQSGEQCQSQTQWKVPQWDHLSWLLFTCCVIKLLCRDFFFFAMRWFLWLESSDKAEQSLISCFCASTARLLFDVMHVWAECLDSRIVWLPAPQVPAGWG